MKIFQNIVPGVLFGVFIFASGCAQRTAETMVVLHVDGVVREVPARCFDEAGYLKRGYLKNTDAQGNAIYVFIPETDRPPEEYGNTGKGILWFGDRGGGQGSGGMGAVTLGGGGDSPGS